MGSKYASGKEYGNLSKKAHFNLYEAKFEFKYEINIGHTKRRMSGTNKNKEHLHITKKNGSKKFFF